MIGLEHTDIRYFVEHGIEWADCYHCGAQWDAATEEQVTEGDGFCAETSWMKEDY